MLIIVSLTFYFTISIIKDYFVNDAVRTGKFFTGMFIESLEEKKWEDELIEEFIRKSPGEKNESNIEYTTCIRYNSDNESMQFKDYYYPIEKPENTFRIVALGDSFTQGVLVKTNDTWPKQLERKLNELDKKDYEVLNFGGGGFNTEDEVRIFKEYALLYNPDMVILQFHFTDLWNNTRIEENIERYHNEYELGIRDIPDEIKKLNPTDVGPFGNIVNKWFHTLAFREESMTCIENPFDYCWKTVEIHMIELVDITKSLNADLMVFTFDRDSQETYALGRLSKEHNFKFLDLYKYIEPFDDEIKLPNDNHFNEKGYGILSDKILDYLMIEKL